MNSIQCGVTSIVDGNLSHLCRIAMMSILLETDSTEV